MYAQSADSHRPRIFLRKPRILAGYTYMTQNAVNFFSCSNAHMKCFSVQVWLLVNAHPLCCTLCVLYISCSLVSLSLRLPSLGRCPSGWGTYSTMDCMIFTWSCNRHRYWAGNPHTAWRSEIFTYHQNTPPV